MKQHLAALLRAVADQLDPPKTDDIHITTLSEDAEFELFRHFNRRHATPGEWARLRSYVPAVGR